jgi:hypothetical protein
MAYPDAVGRRIIFSTHVVPTQSVEGEETSIRHTEFVSTVNKALGGKGNATINPAQWGDQWSSATHPLIQNWEEFTTVNWEDVLIHPAESGKITISTTGIQLSSDGSDCAFLYVKNLGTDDDATYDDEVLVSLNGISGNYYITIPPNGSVCLRGDGTTLDCNDIYVKCSFGETTQVEYLIAKE